MNPRRFVLLDRDGTITVERHYLSDPAQVELTLKAGKGLRRLADAGFGLVMVTNQSGIERGYFDEQQLGLIHSRLAELLAAEGVQLAGIYHCPHTDDANCDCRKPRPGMALQAAADLSFNPRLSFVIGDKPCDIDLGRAVGATTLLVRTGYGRQYEREGIQADYVVDDLDAAADVILRLTAER